jgi:hypothetical protein
MLKPFQNSKFSNSWWHRRPTRAVSDQSRLLLLEFVQEKIHVTSVHQLRKTRFMDLPTCPACGQSVLDDDVEECPFCGASMSGKPSKTSTKPAPKPVQSSPGQKHVENNPAAHAPPAEPSASVPISAEKQPKPEADEDDPFAIEKVEKSETGKVIRLHSKPVKGRSHKVICPMCDTAGFTSRKAAGHEVRCPNPNCQLPVFTAPEIKKQEPVEEEAASSALSPPMLIGSVIAAVVVIGGVVWFFYPGNKTFPSPSGPSGNVIADGAGNDQPTTEDGFENSDQKQKSDGEKIALPAKTFNPVEVREDVLKIMVDLSERLRGTNEARKPLSVRMTAESFAFIGDKQRAENQLKRLDVLGRSFPGYKISVLSILAWKELDSSRDDAAKKLLDEALTSSEDLNQLGRNPIDAATALSTALAAVGRNEEARDLISRHSNNESLGQVSSLLLMMQQSGNYDLDAHITAGPVYPSQAQQWIAVTYGLAVKQRRQESLAWAESHTDSEGRTDCVIAWAEVLANHRAGSQQAGGLSRIEKAAEKLTPAGKFRLWARVAGRQLAAGDKTGAEKSLASARGVLKSIPVPKPFVLPESRQLYRLGSSSNSDTGLPDLAPLRISALAAAEAARVEIQLGQTEQAWKSIQLVMAFARGMAPALSSIQKKLVIADEQPGSIRGELSRFLNINSKDRNKLQRVLNRYIKQCERIRDAALARHRLQTQLFAEAAQWGLEDKVWDEIRSRSEHNDLNQKEFYYTTSVPVILANRFVVSGANDRVKEIQSIFTGGNLQPNAQEEIKQATIRHLADDAGVQNAATALEMESNTLDPYVRELWALQSASRLVKSGKTDRAVRFAFAMKDPILRENILMLVAAQATGIGHGETIWKLIQSGSRQAMDRIALCRGFVAGSVTHASHATSKPSVFPPTKK